MNPRSEFKVLSNLFCPAVSVVIPAFNEELNIHILANEIEAVFSETEMKWEVIWVDDCSSDSTWEAICNLPNPHRGIRLSQNSGQSTALMAGIDNASFDIIITLDADLQNDPSDIPSLIEAYRDGVDVVAGYRVNRRDLLLKRRLPSLVANSLSKKITGVQVKDLGCTLRLFKKELVARNRLVGEMHRVILLHFAFSGAYIVEVPTNHRRRIHGTSNYGLERTLKFVADLLLAKLMNLITSKPLYLFGSASLITLLVSIVLFSSAFLMRIFKLKDYIDATLIVGSLLLASTSALLFCLGLIAEILLRVLNSTRANSQYAIRNKNNLR